MHSVQFGDTASTHANNLALPPRFGPIPHFYKKWRMLKNIKITRSVIMLKLNIENDIDIQVLDKLASTKIRQIKKIPINV